MSKISKPLRLLFGLVCGLALTGAFSPVMAQDAAPAETPPPAVDGAFAAYVNNTDPGAGLAGVAGPGHNGFMMICAALVLFMTLPGLALFYGGLVRKKNVLSVLAQCLGITGLVTLMWWAFGYSLVFGTSFSSPFIGGTEFLFLKGVTSAPNTNYAYWISQNVFAMYQLMFAIITPALIVGAIAERMKFTAVIVFVALWMIVVYFPLAHMIWGATGLMNGVWNADAAIPAIDFAGGTVVHMSSGWSALVLCLILGPRVGFGKEKMPPHSLVLCMVGTGMLYVGWYGFNAGSALAADGVAANAFMTTTLAAAVAGFVWGLIEKITRGHASVLGFCSGIVAGLVVITPAAGFVDATGSVIIGVLAGVVPFLACTKLKAIFKYDDALDTFGVHAVGGTLGALVTGLLATADVNSNLISAGYAEKNGLATLIKDGGLWVAQLKAIGITLVLSIVGTIILAYIVKAIIGLRPTPEAEQQGLDITDHSEEGYIL
ncbi:Ammonia channel precursor [Lacunisphaera limnophila]|uniref:Ammonium transporter n=1 Tax=Lacunisphaera limnophila TaxID=1838286 RepID=A0A1D8AZM5_9BACT|nr:ammonium transporter [Lacunisphaera limnophila]AOS46343.1 Ammonia channel precursor [Lacunisphaera limnophila]